MIHCKPFRRLLLFTLVVPVFGLCQSGPTTQDVPAGYKNADAIVEVSNGRPGEQVVDVAFLEASYPTDKISAHLKQWEAEGGKPATNADVQVRGMPSVPITHLRFATTGLVNRDTGAVDIQPIVRAFSGMDNLDIWFQIPKLPYKGYATFKSPYVEFTTRLDMGVQFFVHIKKHDPGGIVIPSIYQPPPPQVPPPPKHTPVFVYILIALVLSLGAGALVYYVLTRASSSEAR